MNLIKDYGVESFIFDCNNPPASFKGVAGIAEYRYPSPIGLTCKIGNYPAYKSVQRDNFTLHDLYYFHYMTAGKFLPKQEAYPLIVEILENYPNFGKGKIIGWGNRTSNADFFLKFDNLKLFKDRIEYIKAPKINSDAFTELKAGGIKLSEIYKPYIEFIDGLDNFKYSLNTVNFLRDKIIPIWFENGLFLKFNIPSKIRQVYRAPQEARWNQINTDKHAFAVLFGLYLSDYVQWFESGSYIQFDDCDVYVDHHTIFETTNVSEYYKTHPQYPNMIPYGIHPNEYFKDRIAEIAKEQYEKYHMVKYPKWFKGVIDLSLEPHRQLINGVQLVEEGRKMHHCVGGVNYLDSLTAGEMLFFHLDVPDLRHGATLSLKRTDDKPGNRILNGEGWKVDQYYGFDDESLRNHVDAQATLSTFLDRFFPLKPVEVEKLKEKAIVVRRPLAIDLVGAPAGWDGVIDSMSQLEMTAVGALQYQNRQGPPVEHNAFRVSIDRLPNPIMDNISKWMELANNRAVKDYSLNSVVDNLPEDRIFGDTGGMIPLGICGQGSSFGSSMALTKYLHEIAARRDKLFNAVEKQEVVQLTVDLVKHDGDVIHKVMPDVVGVKGSFHYTPPFGMMGYEFTDMEMSSWVLDQLSDRQVFKIYGTRNSLKFATNRQMDNNIKLIADERPIFLNPNSPSPLFGKGDKLIQFGLRDNQQDLKHLHFDVSIIADNQHQAFNELFRVKVGDFIQLNLPFEARLKFTPIYSSTMKLLSHCVNMVNGGMPVGA